MLALITKFLKWLFYLPILDPLFRFIGKFLNCAPDTVKRYGSQALERFFSESMIAWLGYVVVPIAIIVLLVIFGYLNTGNLPKYSSKKMTPKNSSLKGKNIVFLGSSVTKGMASQGNSFVDMIAARTGAKCVKEAVSGTTLVDNGRKSYVARLKAIDPKTACDLFVCQLSTNDATKKKPLGKVAVAGEAYDTKTICGAIEYIINYAKKTWNCPVAFYTNPEYASPEYKDMVEALYAIAKKWDIAVIDLWNDRELNTKEAKKRSCMNDQIHPTKKGYALWTPVMEAALENVIAGKDVPTRPKTEPAVAKEQLKKKKNHKLIGQIIAGILAFVLLFSSLCGIAGYIYCANMFGYDAPGNAKEYWLENVTPHTSSPLEGKVILGVGSSVMAGWSARTVGPGEYLCKLNNATYIRECATGTSVTTKPDGTSLDNQGTYLPRLMKHTAEENVDIVIIQLGTNDTADWVEVGVNEPGVSLNLADYNEYTYCGAMQSMIAYSINTWGTDTKVVIYSNSRFTSKDVEKYQSMVDQTKEIIDKWQEAGYGVYLMDMWSDAEFNNVPADKVELYNAGEIHPRMAGYLEWWMPFWENFLYKLYE